MQATLTELNVVGLVLGHFQDSFDFASGVVRQTNVLPYRSDGTRLHMLKVTLVLPLSRAFSMAAQVCSRVTDLSTFVTP